jgi:hypothetical protein
MIADDPAARAILEEDRQAEAILKEFVKGNYVPRREDSAANPHAIRNMMSPGRRITRDSAIKGQKQKLVVTTHCLCSMILFCRKCFLNIGEGINQTS